MTFVIVKLGEGVRLDRKIVIRTGDGVFGKVGI